MRLAYGLSSADLAIKIGVEHETLLDWESGKTRIFAGNLFTLSIVFDCDASVFFDGLVHAKQTNDFR